MLILESHRFWVGPEIAIKSIEHENAKESTKYCFLSKWLLSLSRKPTFSTFLQVLCGPWKMLKKAKDTVPFGEWCFQFFVRFWKDTNETFQKWQEKCTKTYLCEDYINFTTHELKTFCIEAYSVLGLCLHVHVICKVLSSPSPPQGYCGTPLCTWPLMRSSIPLLWRRDQCYWTCSGIFLYWRGNLFYFAAWDWSQSQMGIPLGLHSWFNATHKNPVV